MSKNQETKKEIVSELTDKFNKAQTAVLVDYRGLTVEEDTELRSLTRKESVDYKIYKNTLMRLAVREVGLEGMEEYLTGPSGIAFGYDDPVAAAKIMANFAKSHTNLEIKAGMVDGKVLDQQGVKDLAELPPREVLIAKALGGLNAPISGFVNVLNGNIRGLVIALNQIKEQKEATA